MASEYLTPAQKASRAINKADTASQAPCYVCKKMLWISFFFDAPKRDAIEDKHSPERLTNVGKIFSAHTETDTTRGVYRIYFNGLQKPLEDRDSSKTATKREIGDKTLEDAIRDKINDAGNDVIKTAAKSHKLELDSFWKLLNPWSWKDVVAKIIYNTATESISTIRDNPVFSSVSNSGVTTRINNAIDQFKNITRSQTQEITNIRIAIFGADLGGAIARAFANKLINENLTIKDEKIFYGKTEIEFMFMGLFDCVSSRSNDQINKLALSKASLGVYSQGIDEPMGIRPQFQCVYHAVAAHENRVYKRIDSVRKCKAPLVQEELFPGEQGDVVGGHRPNEQGRSNELSRLPLMRMYANAMGQAVPLRSLETLQELDRELALSFQLTDKLVENGIPRDTVARILSIMKPGLDKGSLESSLAAAAGQRLQWLAFAYADPTKRQKYFQIFDRLDRQIRAINNAFNDPISNSSFNSSAANETLRRLLNSELKLMGKWQRDFNDYNGRSRHGLSAADVTCGALFEQFIHDALTEMKDDGVDVMESALTTGTPYWGYLTRRPIDESDKFKAN